MKFVFTISLSIILFFTSNGQRYQANVVMPTLGKDMRSRTLVVIPFDNAYDQSLVKSVNDFWTFSPVREGTHDDIERLKKDNRYALLYLTAMEPYSRYQYSIFTCGKGYSSFPMALARVFPQLGGEMKKKEKASVLKNYKDAAFLTPFYILRLQYSLEAFEKDEMKVPRLKLKKNERAIFNRASKDQLKNMKIYVLQDLMTSDEVGRFASYLEVPISNFIIADAEILNKKLYERNNAYAFVYERDDAACMAYDCNGKWLALATSLTSRKNRKEMNSAQRTVWTAIGVSLGCIAGLTVLGLTVGED